jgi:enoyl-CoA hydratase
VARQRLLPAYLSRTVVNGEMFGPAEAVTAGFFDRLVPAAELERATMEAALAISKINLPNHALAKQRLRGEAIAKIRRLIDEDITPRYGEDRVAGRAASS